MKLARLFGCFLVLACPLCAQKDDCEIVKKLNADWINSYVTGDATVLEGILADDMILTDPTNTVFDKKAMLAGFNNRDVTVLSDHVDEVTVRLFGATAIVNARTTYVFKTKTGQTTGHNCYMDVYIKRDGRWKCVAAHVSLLKQ